MITSEVGSPIPCGAFPRLYARAGQIARVRQVGRLPLLERVATIVRESAEQYTASCQAPYDPGVHNSLLIRARVMQCRVITLLVRWLLDGETRFRDAAWAHLQEMDRWEYWSWHAWRQGDKEPHADFDLSYGENCATLAIAYDWLANSLGKQDRAWFIGMARRRGLQPFLKHARPQHRKWWFAAPQTNWNTVCAGGAGMLALALHGEAPESEEALALVEESIAPYMLALKKTSGGWPEGTGYWNYGMRYAFMYLLSRENATGVPHPLMEQPETRATLRFPLDFCPNGCPCSFGDVNEWNPLPLHYAVAERLGDLAILAALEDHTNRLDYAHQPHWPNAAELLLFHPGKLQASPPIENDVLRCYKGLDWCLLADSMPHPSMYLAIRGGTTKVPHSHLDLMSFHCVIGNDAMITSLGVSEYMETTFSGRRFELFETTPPSKNTLLINGVGLALDSTVETTCIEAEGLRSVRIDATKAMGETQDNAPAASVALRLFIMLGREAFLIIDHVEMGTTGRLESRMHTRAAVELSDHTALLRGRRERLSIAYACSVPAYLTSAEDAMTVPDKDGNPKVLRWCTQTRTHREITMATLLVPGGTMASVSLETQPDGWAILIQAGPNARQLHVTRDLFPTVA